MALLTPTPKQQIFGADGNPLVGGKIFTYLAGTSTPATTYKKLPPILIGFGR